MQTTLPEAAEELETFELEEELVFWLELLEETFLEELEEETFWLEEEDETFLDELEETTAEELPEEPHSPRLVQA